MYVLNHFKEVRWEWEKVSTYSDTLVKYNLHPFEDCIVLVWCYQYSQVCPAYSFWSSRGLRKEVRLWEGWAHHPETIPLGLLPAQADIEQITARGNEYNRLLFEIKSRELPMASKAWRYILRNSMFRTRGKFYNILNLVSQWKLKKNWFLSLLYKQLWR